MMKVHHFLSFFLITTLVIFAHANEDADYDEGYVENQKIEKLPEPQPQVAVEEPKTIENAEFNLFNGSKFPKASVYIPLAVATGVLLNVIVISVLVMLKRRRVTSYRKMQLERATPVFREIQSEI